MSAFMSVTESQSGSQWQTVWSGIFIYLVNVCWGIKLIFVGYDLCNDNKDLILSYLNINTT